MKASFVLVSLLPLLGAAYQLVELPTLDTNKISDNLYNQSASEQAEHGEVTAESCPKGYPFLCDGHCCKYNICCKKECCLPSTDFCGADGYCYKYT